MKQTLLFTTLPVQATGGKPRIAVVVSPRLEPDAVKTLDQFPALLNWPATLANDLTFSVEVQGKPAVPATPVASVADGATWANLFKKDTPIRGFEARHFETRNIRSYSVGSVLGHVQGLYRQVAETNPADHPVYNQRAKGGASDAISGFIGSVGALVRREQEGLKRGGRTRISDSFFDKERKAVNFNTVYSSMGAEQRKQLDFALADEFHDRPGRQTLPTDKKFPEIKNDDLEFHEIVSAMGNYPQLMKTLGLVIELDVQMNASDLPSSGMIRVIPKWKSEPGYNQHPKQPWTHFSYSSGRFIAQERPGGDFRNRMLLIESAHDDHEAFISAKTTPRFSLLQVDPDGAAMKAVDYARNFFRLSHGNPKTYTTPDTAALPALRTSGIGLFRFNRGYEVWQHLIEIAKTEGKFSSGADAEVWLDDVVRGYRIDIAGSDGVWHSLHERLGFYHFTKPDSKYSGDNPLQIQDEGYIRGASASSDLAGSDDLYLHESMVRWEGWSLAASRPGKTIVRQEADKSTPVDPKLPAEVPREKRNTAEGAKNVYMEANFNAVPKSLPRLRFGETYRLRARTVDLGGYGPKLDDAPSDPDYVTDKLFYSRFEPVPQPALVLRDPVAEGESIERMVIRSDFDRDAAKYSEDVKAKFGREFLPQSFRHVAPSKTSQLMAEVHGKFDEWLKSGDVKFAYNVARKEEGTFLDRTIFDPKSPGSPIEAKGLAIVTPTGTPVDKGTNPIKFKVVSELEITDPAKQEVWQRGDPLAPGQYVIHQTDDLVLPYLPDPFCRGVALLGLRDAAGSGGANLAIINLAPFGPGDHARQVMAIRFQGEWPFLQPFMIRIIEREGKMEGDNCDETFVSAADPPKWDGKVLTIFLGKAEAATIRYSSFMDRPDAEKMGVVKWLKGSPKRDDAIKFAQAGQNWMMTPFRELQLVHAVQHPLCAPKIKKYESIRRIGDTYTVFKGEFLANVASTGRIDVKGEWTDRIDPLDEDGPREPKGAGDAYHFDVPATLDNKIPIPAPIGKEADYFKHEFNDTRYRKIRYRLIGTSRFREYFPEQIWSDPDNITRVGELFTDVKVLSSARPAAPKILYILPTFGWTDPEATSENEIVSKRCGGGLRVYMDRPWYSSGDEELLGIVIHPRGQVSEDDPLRPFVTQWGMDPIWAAYPAYRTVQLGHFKSIYGDPGLNVSLDESSAGRVHVVGYKPEYDATRQLWYCDIEMDAGPAYTPFVRLALVRFQPNSVDEGKGVATTFGRVMDKPHRDVYISRVVVADFAQLAPDRSASITFVNPKALMIYVSGVPAISIASMGKKNLEEAMGATRQVMATLEEQFSPADAEMGWAPVGDVEVTLVPTVQKEFGFKVLWQGRLMLPDLSKRFPGGTKTYRIVIKEWEYLESDRGEGAISRDGKFFQRRLVYVDAINLQ